MDRPSGFQQRPPYPHLLPSSTPSSVFQSSSSLASVSSFSSTMSAASSSGAAQQHPTSPTSPSRRQFPQLSQAHFQSTGSAAPLPSPTVGQPSQYFGSLQEREYYESLQERTRAQAQAAQERQMQYQRLMQQEMQTRQQNHQQQQQQRQPTQGSFDYRPNPGSTAPETNSFLRDYSLLAEAAKRAQMAVLERDLGGMDMS